MYSKVEIFNLALSALLLNKEKELVDVETDKSNEARVLRLHYNAALNKTLQDLDLNRTRRTVTLELVEEDPNDLWCYAYKYPNNCAFLRRIVSSVRKDSAETHIDREIQNLNGISVILTDETDASAEIIPNDINLSALNASAGMALAYQLAFMCAPLLTGKGAKELRKEIWSYYQIFKTEAQEHDSLENSNPDDPTEESEFVKARMS